MTPPEIAEPGRAGNGHGVHSPAEFYVASDIKSKRHRRTKARITGIKKSIIEILEADNPQTVRQVYYALTVKGKIAKTETEYQRTVVRLLTSMRDRRNLWTSMPVYLEVWVEKDALAGVLLEESKVYDVPLMVAKGYSSITFLHTAAMAIQGKGKPAYVYHFGDLDPSGRDAARVIEVKLRRYAPGAEIHFECPAVTREQVEQWNLPTRPTKQTDTRAKKFGSATSVELDAIPARKLRELVRDVINRHVDQQKLELLRTAEKSERELLTAWAATYRGSMR